MLLQTILTIIFLETDDVDPRTILFGLLLSGFIFYGVVYLRHRNTDKRHHHEEETKFRVKNIRKRDRYIRTMTGLSNSKMHGANHNQVSSDRKNGKTDFRRFLP